MGSGGRDRRLDERDDADVEQVLEHHAQNPLRFGRLFRVGRFRNLVANDSGRSGPVARRSLVSPALMRTGLVLSSGSLPRRFDPAPGHRQTRRSQAMRGPRSRFNLGRVGSARSPKVGGSDGQSGSQVQEKLPLWFAQPEFPRWTSMAW